MVGPVWTSRVCRVLGGLLLVLVVVLGISAREIPNYAASPLCVMEIWTPKPQFRTDEQVELVMWVKVNANPDLPDIADARLELELRPPFGTFITLRTQEDVALNKGAEWEQALLTLPVNSEPFRNLGDYQAHATLFSASDDVLCESYTSFTIRSIFGQDSKTRTLIVTSRRTDVTEPFVSRLSVWLEASYRTRVQVIYQEGILQSYQSGVFEDFDVVIYYGTDFAQPPPPALITDLGKSDALADQTIIWLGYHLDRFADHLADYGLSYGSLTSGNSPSPLRYADTGATFTLLNQDRTTVRVADDRLAQVRATVDDEPIIASARHVSRPTADPSFYFVGFHPTAFLTPFGGHLVVLDLLNEVYGIQRAKTALIRLEDIDAREDADQLLNITSYLRNEGIPFTLAVIPIFRDGEKTEIRLSRDRAFRRLVKNALLDGGELVLHGASHQYEGETGVDFEFWDEKSNTPIGDAAYAEARVAEALMEIEFSGLMPHLVGWETPHYRAGDAHYDVFESYFSLLYEGPHWNHQLDLTPYPIQTEHSLYVPTNLDFVRGASVDDDINQMLAHARVLSGLKHGGLASFFYHPQLGLEGLQRLVNGLRDQGWSFAPVSSLVDADS